VRERLGIAESTPVVMAAARFRHRKVLNLEYLFNALRLLREEGVFFQLMVVGDGPGEEDVRLLAGKALGDRVIFAGGIPPGEMFRMYSAADLFAFPGIGESLGMVYLEAQGCGLPVVALNTAGVPQVVRDGETGILVPEDDGGAMAEAIERLIRNPGLRATIAGRAARYVRRERNLHLNYLEFSRQIEAIAACHPPI
jgi:glycosyltransferase involved in cell wall biosynthesis